MATIEKDFDLLQVLDEAAKKLEVDTIVASAKKEALMDVAKFIITNNLRVLKPETDTDRTEQK